MNFRPWKSLLAFALILLMGFNLAVLQTAAWAGMLATNLRRLSVSDAVARTFDGRHPCPLCKAIAAQQKSEKKSELSPSPLKMEYVSTAETSVLLFPAFVPPAPLAAVGAKSLFPRPPTPPPRSVLA